MGYRLACGEPVADGLRRALVEELDSAAAALADLRGEQLAEGVHEARKSLKKSRTIIRLLRDLLGQERYAVANGRLRAAGRALSSTRDADVLVAGLEGILARGQLQPATVAGLRERLTAERAEAHRLATELAGPRSEALERIAAGRADAERWQLAGADQTAAVLAGLTRLYRRGQRRMLAAHEDPSPTALHEWRKRVKDLGYTLRLVAPAWPAVLEPLAAEAQRQWDLLGDDHDLVLLAEAATVRSEVFARRTDLDAFHDVIAARRAELQQEAFALGARLYADKPNAFARRIDTWLEVWNADDQAR